MGTPLGGKYRRERNNASNPSRIGGILPEIHLREVSIDQCCVVDKVDAIVVLVVFSVAAEDEIFVI